jgi:hypothetical protein
MTVSQPTTSSNLYLRNSLPSQRQPVRTASTFGAKHLKSSVSAPLSRSPAPSSDSDASEQTESDDQESEDADDESSEPSEDHSDPAVYDIEDMQDCWNMTVLAFSGCLYDVNRSLSLPLPVTFMIAKAFQRVVTHALPSDISQQAIKFLCDLYHDEYALKDRASMVYVCAITMTFLFQLDRRDDRQKRGFFSGFFKYGMRHELGISEEIPDEDCQQLVLSYFTAIAHSDMIMHTLHSVLAKYAAWFNGGREAYMAALATTTLKDTLQHQLQDIHGDPFPDNFKEYEFSVHNPLQVAVQPRSYVQAPHVSDGPLVVDCPAANPTDIALFIADEHGFYHRSVEDLDELTTILHQQKHCCRSISAVSYGPLRYDKANECLDDKISILAWVVSEFISIRVPYREFQPAHDRVAHDRVIQRNLHHDHMITVRVAKFNQYPYEELLARAYSLRLLHTAEHPEDCVYPCCKHFFRETFPTDTIYKQHWYRWEEDFQKDIPLSLTEHHRLLNSRAEYIHDVINDVRYLGIFIERNFQAHPTVRIQVHILMHTVNLKIPILHWLKCHDHVSENVWQKLLCYMYVLYFSLQHYKANFKSISLPENMNTLYVPSLAVRHSDATINPLLLRRLVILPTLSKTSARKVYDMRSSRVVPCVSILKRLFCPDSIHAAIDKNIMHYVLGIYIVRDVHVIAPPTPAFIRDLTHLSSSTHRYLDVILFLEDLLVHYSSNNVHPRNLVLDLLYGHCLDSASRQAWLDHLQTIKAITGENCRKHLVARRLRSIKAYTVGSYADMMDTELQDSIKTIQQLLVEYGVLFGEGPMELTEENDVYNAISYTPLPENQFNIGGFTGFNFLYFHKVLLKFWYYYNDGLYSDKESLNYLDDFMVKLHQLESSSMTPYMIMWMQWAIAILEKVVDMLKQYFTSKILEYQAQDKNRVTLLAWEVVLTKFDNIDGPLVMPWYAELRHEVHMAYIRYHSNINYHVNIQVDNLFIPDNSMVSSFEDPPVSSHLKPRFAPGHIYPFDFEDQITATQLVNGTQNQSPSTSTSTAIKRMTMADLYERRRLDIEREDDPDHVQLLPSSIHFYDPNPLRNTKDINPNCLPYYIDYSSKNPFRDPVTGKVRDSFRNPPSHPLILQSVQASPLHMEVDDPHVKGGQDDTKLDVNDLKDYGSSRRSTVQSQRSPSLHQPTTVPRPSSATSLISTVMPCPHIGGGVLSGGTLSTPPRMLDHVFRINSHSVYSTSDPAHIAHLKSGGTFESLPAATIRTSTPVPPPAYQPPPIHRTLTDDEKKRRVQRNLLPSPQRVLGEPRYSSFATRDQVYLQQLEYTSQDRRDEAIRAMGLTMISNPPTDDPPELMSDNSDDEEYNRPLTYDEDPIHSNGHDVTLVPAPVPNPTGRPSTHEMEERSLQYATDQLRVIQDNYPSLFIERPLTSKLPSSPVLHQSTVSSMQDLNEVRINQASSMYNEHVERSLREAREEIRALRLQIQPPLTAPSPDPPLLADNDKESPEESPDLSSYLIPIAIPTDKIDQFARNVKQDSQIQSFVSSQSSSTMYPAIVQSIPPLPLAPVVAPVVPSDPSIASQPEVPVARRRIQPAPVDTINKRQHFPTTLHAYFDGVGYPPGMSQVEVEYLDDCIIQHCCQNNRMEKLPQLDEQALQAIKVFQNDNLIRQLVGTHIAPSLMLEVMYNYMEGIFIVQRSTIPNSGDGLFLRPGKILQQGILLPYPGVILSQVSPNQLVENDKLVCLRKSIYLDGSSAQVFPVSGNTYPNFLAKANESVCHNMMEANKGKIINCGMVLFEDRIPASPMCTEIFVLYSPLTTSVQALSEEPPHRTTIKQKVLLNLFEHMDDVFLGSRFYMEERFRSNVKSYFRKIQDKEDSINFYRVLGRHTVGDNDSVVRYIQACISVVDGRFMDHVKQVYPKVFKAIASKSTITVSFNNITRGQIYLPIALLLHIHSWFYYGNYQDPVRSVEIRRQGTNHHRNMIQSMITDNILVTSSNQLRKLLLQHGIVGFTNPRFTLENMNTDDDSDNEEDEIADLSVHGQSDDEVIISSSTRSSPTPSNHRTSPVPMTTMIQDSVHVQVAPVPVSSVNASCPPQSIFNRHEKADEEIEIPVTPLTMQTQRENLRQDMRAILYQEGQLPLAPRYEASHIYRTRDNHHHRDRHSRESYHDQHSRPSFSTQEMEQGLQDYDPNILPNTIQEALRWSGTNNKTYDYYLPEDEDKQKGNLSGHPLVKNSLDMQTQSTLYNDIMVLTTILLTFWSVEIANYHRLDRVKGDFALNDRAKIATFDTKYDGTSCLYTYTSRLLQHFAQHRLPYVLLYNILSKGTDLSGGALIEWQAQVDSANSSLVPEDITNTLLRAPSLHCYQMRSIVVMIVDLIVFRVLIFNQLKNKTVIRQELFQLKMESNIGSVTYDGILALSQKIIRTFRLFLLEDNVVQDLVKTLAGCIKNSGPAYAQTAADFHSAMSTRIKDFVRDQRDAFRSLDRQEQNIRIFAVIELYCRDLQDSLRQSFNINGQSLAMTSPASPSYATTSPGKTYHTSSSFRPRGLPSPTPSFKRVNVHSASLQSQDVQHQQSHYHHISERVDCEINQVHMFAQAKTLRDLLDDQFEELPAGAVLTVAEGATEPTIHVQVAHVYDMDVSATTTAVIDTRYTIDKAPYDGNCTLCGDRRHDKKHCRMSSYEHPEKVNLVNYSYFSEDILMDKIQRAKDHGFLRGATQDEINWVLEKIKELRQQRALLYANKSVGNSNYPSRGTPPRSGSPYGYHRPPSPYERQPFHSVPTQSL